MVFSSISFGEELGVGVFPGSAWDMSDPENPRRLNICFFERDDGNLLWDPISVNGMDLEYVLIMASDYDSTGMAYDNIDITTSATIALPYASDIFSNPTMLEFAESLFA